ncbi:MAG: NAD(P)H-dependent oxidoreductase [Candidatus Falkowbacteria bacterium]|nr:NAD(P)H-dependent oxidoreductase [Candidatus Falkowbacteria bacterium]
MKHIIEALNWRYATKQFNKDKKLSTEEIDNIIEAIRLTPSSFGLQPYKVFVITNSELREKLKQAAYNQTPLTDASHVIVFTVPTDFSETQVDAYLNEVANTRGMTTESLQGFKSMMMGFVSNHNTDQLKDWAARQAYIALGQLLTVAAIAKIDAVPMEGFNPAQFDEILNLKEKNLASVVAAGLGFRDEADAHAALAKVRFKKDDLFVELK